MMEKLAQSTSEHWRYIRLPHSRRMAKLCCNGSRSLVSVPNTVSACCDDLRGESEARMNQVSASPATDMDRQDRLVSGWLWFGMLLLCLFREQLHHISKPGLKHRDFDEPTTMQLRMTNITAVHKNTRSLRAVILCMLRSSLS